MARRRGQRRQRLGNGPRMEHGPLVGGPAGLAAAPGPAAEPAARSGAGTALARQGPLGSVPAVG